MEIKEAMETRRSCRCFSQRPVPRELVEQVLRLAGRAPSALNLQPWEVTVVMGREMDRLSKRLLKAHSEKRAACGPGARKPIPESHQSRRRETFRPLNEILKEMGLELEAFVGEGSCRFYGAPVGLVLSMDCAYSMERYLCMGILVGYLVLAAHDVGLSTCPIGLISAYGEEIKDQLNIPEEKEVVLAVAMGYEDRDSPLTRFTAPREPLKSWVRWYC